MSDEYRISWFDRVPKVELHIHLEGAIPLPTMQRLINKYEKPGNQLSMQDLEKRFMFIDFLHFLKVWTWKNQYLREYDDFILIAEETAKSLAQQNIRYVEMFYSPVTFVKHGLSIQGITEAIRKGFNRVAGISISLIVDFVRDNGPEEATTTLAAVKEVRGCDVVGVNIGGTEFEFPPEPFAAVYEQARQAGFFTSAHAGEGAGPDSIRGVIETLHVDRIGHGTRAIEDDRLMAYLREHLLPIEVCPLSNVQTRVVTTIKDHPVREFFTRGIPISINTDDPMMFGNSLADEYRALVNQCNFSCDEVRELIINGINMSWQGPDEKDTLLKAITQDSSWAD